MLWVRVSRRRRSSGLRASQRPSARESSARRMSSARECSAAMAMALGAATISNDLVFTTTFDGTVIALSREDGSIVWQDDLGTRTNAPLTIAGDTLVTAASYPAEAGQLPKIVAYRLGGSAR